MIQSRKCHPPTYGNTTGWIGLDKSGWEDQESAQKDLSTVCRTWKDFFKSLCSCSFFPVYSFLSFAVKCRQNPAALQRRDAVRICLRRRSIHKAFMNTPTQVLYSQSHDMLVCAEGRHAPPLLSVCTLHF